MEYQGVGKHWKTMSLAGKSTILLWMYFLLEKSGLFPANYVTSDVLLPNTTCNVELSEKSKDWR